METTTMEQQQSTKKAVTPEFVKLSDLQVADVKNLKKFPITFVRSFSKNGREQVSMVLKLHDPQFNQLTLRKGGPKNYVTPSFFHLVLTKLEALYKDKLGKDINEWKYNVLCRFVEGNYKDSDDTYKSVEVIFRQGLYMTHFFDYDDTALLKLLEEKKILKLDWVQRPDAILKEEESIAEAGF